MPAPTETPKPRVLGGRPERPAHLKRVAVPLRLPQWLADWIEAHGSPGDVIESALIERHKLKPPKP